MKKIIVDAVASNVNVVTEYINEQLETMNCSMMARIQIDIVVDEIFSNIAKYAYVEAGGKAEVIIEKTEDLQEIKITFCDEGIPYNPLEKTDPDITLAAEERQIGGLGIFMVKKITDDMKYEYSDGKNRLSVWKKV